MTITTEMMVSKGAVTYQTDIMDSLGGSLNTANTGAVVAAIDAGLDLTWLARKFGEDPLLAPQIEAARRIVQETVATAIEVARAAYDEALAAYVAALATIGAVDPKPIIDAAIKKAVEGIPEAAKLAEAAAFSAIMGD